MHSLSKLQIFLSTFCLYSCFDPICKNEFTLLNQAKCVKYFADPLQHADAESKCKNYGGTLVVIKNAIDNRAVTNFVLDTGTNLPFWIGVSCFGNRDPSLCFYDDNTGNASLYSNFASSYPQFGCGHIHAIGSGAGQWFNMNCSNVELPYVCEIPTTIPDQCKFNYKGNCYYSYTNSPKFNFTDAQDFCQSFKANVFSLHSHSEIDFIKTAIDTIYHDHLLLGTVPGIVGTIPKWLDHTPWDYENFDPLLLLNSTGDCIEINLSNRTDNGMWRRTDCSYGGMFVCKWRAWGYDDLPLNTEAMQVRSTEQAQCNATISVGPGTINAQNSTCTWNLAVTGPYRLGLYFTEFSTSANLTIFDEYENVLEVYSGQRYPYSFLAPGGFLKLKMESKGNENNMFSATFLPF